MDNFKEGWGIICKYLCEEKKIADVAYKTWISRIEPVGIDFENGVITLMVPNEFHRQTLIRGYLPKFEEAYEAVLGTSFDTVFLIPEESERQKERLLGDETSADAGYEFTFDTFIVGSSNKFAHAASMAVAQNPASAYNPLFLYGNSGLGKTHLLCAIGNEIKKTHPEYKVIIIKGEDFANEIIQSIMNKTTAQFRQKYRQTDRPPKEIKVLTERLRSRFEMGLLADIQAPDFETRMAIIKRKAEIIGLDLNDDLCEYIANKLKTNIRQLEGVVKKLMARYNLTKEKPTLSIVNESISDILNDDTPPELTVEKIVDEVSRTFGVDSVGKEFGNRHYSTIVYTVQQVEKDIKNDPSLRDTVEDIIKNIRER